MVLMTRGFTAFSTFVVYLMIGIIASYNQPLSSTTTTPDQKEETIKQAGLIGRLGEFLDRILTYTASYEGIVRVRKSTWINQYHPEHKASIFASNQTSKTYAARASALATTKRFIKRCIEAPEPRPQIRQAEFDLTTHSFVM